MTSGASGTVADRGRAEHSGLGRASGWHQAQWVLGRAPVLWIGAACFGVPTLIRLAHDYWSLETGNHGPLVLATGIWLFARARYDVAAIARPGSPLLTGLALGLALVGFLLASITSMLGVECLGVYFAFLAILYYHVGWRGVRLLWFPLVYLLFMFPQPETIILPFSHALKLALSTGAVSLLSMFGYAVGHGGVVIYVDQYELLVATACSGLSSLIGLGAIGVFYTYMRFEGSWAASAPLLLMIAPIALIANFIRVVLLILVTHYFGNRIAQLYVHDVAAILLFSLAVLMMFAADRLIERVRAARRVRA